jgi:uncharacterized delta-60 repeat protein
METDMATRKSKIKATAALLLAGFLVAALPAPAAGPDPDFGDGGRVDISAPPLSLTEGGVSGIVAGRDWIYLLYETGSGVARVSQNGTPDEEYDWRFSAPRVPNIPGGRRANTMVVQPDGKLLTAGQYDDRPFIARLNVDGSYDQSFGNKGVVVYRGAGTPYAKSGWLTDIEIDAKGRILASGLRGTFDEGIYWSYVRRYLPNGRIDRSFANRGTALFKGPGKQGVDFNALELASGGRILVLRDDPSRPAAVIALKPSGKVERTFAGGKGALNVFGSYVLDTDDSGRIMAFGVSSSRFSGEPGGGCVRIHAFDRNGIRSPSFSSDGVHEVCLADFPVLFGAFDGTTPDGIFKAGFAVQGNGKPIVSIGIYKGVGVFYNASFRLQSDGSVDRSFADDGVFRARNVLGTYPVEGLAQGALVVGGANPNLEDPPGVGLYRFSG